MPKAKITKSKSASKAKTATAIKARVEVVKKVIAKPVVKKAYKKTPPKAKVAAVKKPVAPKNSTKSRKQQQSLELCLILDCTASMGSCLHYSTHGCRKGLGT